MMSRITNENIGRLIWYAECMKVALNEVRSFTPPAKDMRFHHSLFIVNLLSLMDLAEEIFDEDVGMIWVWRMNEFGGHVGENNVGYLRELRNAAVHRGVDIAASGTVVLNHVRSFAPPEVSGRSKKAGTFKTFADTLWEVFEISGSVASSIVLDLAEPSFRSIEMMSLEEMRADYLSDIDMSTAMPVWAKEMARRSADEIPFAEIRMLNSDRLREMLSLGGKAV